MKQAFLTQRRIQKIPRWENSSKKKKENVTTRDLIETDISNMPDGEFKATIIRILSGLEKSMEDIRETLSAETKELKNNQEEMKNAITEIRNRLDE